MAILSPLSQGQDDNTFAAGPSHPSNQPRTRTRRGTLEFYKTINVTDQSHSDMRVESNIIAVQGYGTDSPAKWGLEQEIQNAARELNSVRKLHLYYCYPKYSPRDEFSWQTFLDAGKDLATDLALLAADYPDQHIIIIAHSLGGVLIKKALQLADNAAPPNNQMFWLLVKHLSGLLFLGVPHSGTDEEDTLAKYNRVLSKCVSGVTQEFKSAAQDQAILHDLAKAFHKQLANIPVMSVYESEEPMRSSGRGRIETALDRVLHRKPKEVVPKELAELSHDKEELLRVRLSHTELCNLSELQDASKGRVARNFLRTVLGGMASRSTIVTDPDPANMLRTMNSTCEQALRRRPQLLDQASSRDRPPSVGELLPSSGASLLRGRKATLPCFELPQPFKNQNFTGRLGDIEKIDHFLFPERPLTDESIHAPRIFSLCGMGGVGKTELAMQYAHIRRDRFKAVFWITAGGVSKLASDFGQIPQQLGLMTREEGRDLDTSIEMAKTWLSSDDLDTEGGGEPGKPKTPRWLLIFDNVDTLNLVTNYIPKTGYGCVLVTSRIAAAKTDIVGNSSGCDIDPLKDKEASDLLWKLIKRGNKSLTEDEKQAVADITRDCQGLPLALEQIAGFIRQKGMLFGEFFKEYKKDEHYLEMRQFSSPVQEDKHGVTLATAWSFSNLTSKARRLLRILAFLNSERVPEAMFQGSEQSPNDQGRSRTLPEYTRARSELVERSIIKRDMDEKELTMHRSIQKEVRALLSDTERYECFLDATRFLKDHWLPGDLCSQGRERWARCELLLPHSESLFGHWEENKDKWASEPVEKAFPWLMNETAVYLHERGLSHDGKQYLNLALHLCELGNIDEEPLISDIHLTMGALCNETNNALGCLEHNIKCLARRQGEANRHGRTDLRLAFAHSQMGIAYMMIHQFVKATEYFKESVRMIRAMVEVKDVDIDELGFPSCNLGLAYWIQGQLERANEVLTDLLAQREKRHGKLDQVSYKTGRVLQALGNARWSMAEEAARNGNDGEAERLFDESFKIHQDCLKQYESTLGKFNHRTADACHKLAQHHIRRKEHALAQGYLERALGIWGDRSWFKNESARTSFLRGKHLLDLGGPENREKGTVWVKRATLLRAEITGGDNNKDLAEKDFDDLVCFWSI